jgi:hypothetical protein
LTPVARDFSPASSPSTAIDGHRRALLSLATGGVFHEHEDLARLEESQFRTRDTFNCPRIVPKPANGVRKDGILVLNPGKLTYSRTELLARTQGLREAALTNERIGGKYTRRETQGSTDPCLFAPAWQRPDVCSQTDVLRIVAAHLCVREYQSLCESTTTIPLRLRNTVAQFEEVRLPRRGFGETALL